MVNGSLDQGSLICLGYAYFFSIPEPDYGYKLYAYKNKNMYFLRQLVVGKCDRTEKHRPREKDLWYGTYL